MKKQGTDEVNNTMDKRFIILMIGALTFALGASMATAADALNVTISFGGNETRAALTQQTLTAGGGNITELNVTQNIQTRNWQGYYGSIENSLQLAGASGTFYQWTATGTGWVLFANSSAVDWASIAVAGAPNAVQEDTRLSLTGMDNVSSTMNETNGAGITIAGVTIGVGTTLALNTLSNGGNVWETSLITSGANKIYVGVVDPGNENYNGTAVDYQVMVPVSSGSTRTYYLYAALD